MTLSLAKCIADVHAFHEKFGIDVNPLDDDQQYELRLKRQQEEIDELRDAVTLDDAADAIIDIIYIAAGTIDLLGEDRNGLEPFVCKVALADLVVAMQNSGIRLPLQALWDEVHQANMAKERGTESTSKYGNKFDIVKPKGWVAPDIAKVLIPEGLDPKADKMTVLIG